MIRAHFVLASGKLVLVASWLYKKSIKYSIAFGRLLLNYLEKFLPDTSKRVLCEESHKNFEFLVLQNVKLWTVKLEEIEQLF